MMIQSKSGTGKTLVFGVVMLEAVDLEINTVQGLILAPTREIAFQNAHVIFTIGSEIKGKINCYSLTFPITNTLSRFKRTSFHRRATTRN